MVRRTTHWLPCVLKCTQREGRDSDEALYRDASTCLMLCSGQAQQLVLSPYHHHHQTSCILKYKANTPGAVFMRCPGRGAAYQRRINVRVWTFRQFRLPRLRVASGPQTARFRPLELRFAVSFLLLWAPPGVLAVTSWLRFFTMWR